ncbi:hypothetical protein GMST_25440 [Geomonas silvestris]|uniref:Uncharacterized protein n=1 Tax=Geomonas silvestris TaxID=2740184 RepID=A0A6V8MKK3_9BACT|nr:hypothetical protein GMST_25440 [Geomonas silvestris]
MVRWGPGQIDNQLDTSKISAFVSPGGPHVDALRWATIRSHELPPGSMKRSEATTRKGILRPIRGRAVFLEILLIILISSVPGHTASYPGFELLQESQCSKADAYLVSTLPTQWQKYALFVKSCELMGKAGSPSGFQIVSVWVDEYFQEKYPRQHPRWEPFPKALILDSHLKVVGTLPVVYPRDDITFPDVFYGRWITNVPTEIRIDVENPAEGGDYYYAALVWDESSHSYRSHGTEAIDGTRPR